MRSLQLTDDVHEELKKRAGAEGLSMNRYVGKLMGLTPADKRLIRDFTHMEVMDEETIMAESMDDAMKLWKCADRHSKLYSPKRWAVQVDGLRVLVTRVR